MNQWPTAKIASITSKVGSGATPNGGKDAYVAVGVPLIRSMNVRFEGFLRDGLAYLDAKQAASLDGAVVRADDVLLNITGASIGRVTVAPADLDGARVNQHVCIIRPKPGVESKFLAHYLSSPTKQTQIMRQQVGATRQALTKAMILGFDVPVPPADEQRRIVSKIEELFSELDAGVAALRRVQANLKRYRAAILKAAVTGKLTEEWRKQNPPTETANQLLARILSDRKVATAASPKRKNEKARFDQPNFANELPEGWCWAAIKEVGQVQLGRQRAPQHHTGTHMRPYLRVANVFEDRIDTSDVMEMNFTPEEYETYKLHPKDILLNEGQSKELVGRPAMYRGEVEGACFTNTLVRFQAGPAVLPEYALLVFLAYLKNGRFQKIATITVNIAHLGAGRFADLEFPVPPTHEQHEIVREMERRFTIIRAADAEVERSLKRASRLRQAILKRAFEGRLFGPDLPTVSRSSHLTPTPSTFAGDQ